MNSRLFLFAILVLLPLPGAASQATANEVWPLHADAAMLMYPIRLPTDWKVVPLAQRGVSLLRATAPDGSAALEVYTGIQRADIDARSLARTAIANLLGKPEPDDAQVFRDSRRVLAGVFDEIAIRGVLVGTRAGVAVAMVGRSGQTTLAHYRVLLAPQQDPGGLFDRLVTEYFFGLVLNPPD